MSEARPPGLESVVEIISRKFDDERGFFSEPYNARNGRSIAAGGG
jgi:dTDP-4-dehydrorhamnose 3,5-epimerase-like enzyme